MSELNSVVLIPNAYTLMSSLRSVGYKPETAIADIVDNSITAAATIVKINFIWDGENSKITITDNGTGMDQQQLIASMNLGSRDPNDGSSYNDLGRFGMGLKTAALSLGRKLTVYTKQDDKVSNATWDLDYIRENNDGQWKLVINTEKAENETDNIMNVFKTGTCISIENIDKVVTKAENNREKANFFKLISKVEKHLSMIYHRFLESDKLEIRINDVVVKPWDPYCILNPATQELAEEVFYDSDKNKEVVIQPYVLPHKSKFLSESEFQSAGGRNGWNNHQGIYVYRNHRLIVYGTWFDIIRKEPAFNLARIKLDINSASDYDWKIDIKKSTAVPPLNIKEILEGIISRCTDGSAKVYNSRGSYSKSVAAPHLGYVWEQKKTRAGRYSYYINKKHPILMELNQNLDKESLVHLKSFIALIENFAPFMQSGVTEYLSSKSNPKESIENKIDKEIDLREINEYINSFQKSGFSIDEIKTIILEMPNFRYLADEIKKIFEEKKL